MNQPKLTASRLDAILAGKPNDTGNPFRIIWTAEAIAARIGVSADFVRDTLAKVEGSPVKQIGGRYCAHEGDLLAFFRA
ncbi:hypothetical protein [Agrobacterium sp. P15N1-A]